MKIAQTSLLLFSLFAMSLFTNINAQVTIGSALDPVEGAILDLKEEGVTRKGLGMPRVKLKKLDELTMSDNAIANENMAWEEHTGLLVYNTEKCVSMHGEGLYVWDGNRWESLASRTQYDDDALYQPNSYMVTPGTTKVTIPVEKAFRIWEYYGSADGANRLPAEAVTGPLTPVIYWQDAVIIPNTSALSISGNDRTDVITVNLAGTVKGNAVVALQDGAGKIRWSWHIWVTDDPTKAGLNGNGFKWMDRNLGATSATAGDVGTMGVVYQWGRKDPFPMIKDWGPFSSTQSIAELTLQSGHGELKTKVEQITLNDNAQTNLVTSISSPISFIYKSNFYDWYSPVKTTAPTPDSWNERWDRAENGCFHKSPFDPCPKGWRVPTYKYNEQGTAIDNTSPWQNLKIAEATIFDEKALIWSDFGVYPISGYRHGRDGLMIGVGTYAYTWSGTAHIRNSESAYDLYNTKSTTQLGALARSFGFAVRCVKEWD